MIPLSKISYVDRSGGDANFVIGCTACSPGCLHCYARRIVERAGRDFSKVTLYPEKLARLARVRLDDYAPKRGPGSRPIVFPVDLGDLFHKEVPQEFIFQALDVFAARGDADWLLLTKRSGRMEAVVDDWLLARGLRELPDNIWPGVTVEAQQFLHRAIDLQCIPSRRRWLSVEPMLNRIELKMSLEDVEFDLRAFSWVIVGGESGPGRRPFDKAWARTLRDQCRDAGVPFWFKQGSAYRPGEDCLLDGVEVKEWPK